MRNQGLGSWPARRARMSPDRVALTHGGAGTTYAELASEALGFAHRLRRLGVRRGDRVAYLGVNHPHAVRTLFAAGLLGAVYLPLNFRLTRDELMVIVGDAEPVVVVAGPGHEGAAADLDLPSVTVGGVGGDPIDEPVGLDDLAVLMYTSGTTGRPKGAMLTHGNLTWNVCNHLIDIDLRGDDVVLVAAPLFHIAALAQSLLPILVKGGRAVLVPSFDPQGAAATIAAERVTVMFGVPTMFALLLTAKDADFSSLRILECGGAPVPASLIQAYEDRGVPFLQGYGMTEAAPGVLYLAAEDAARRAGTAGVPVFFSDVRVVTPDGRDTADGEPGEILVSGPNVFDGYWGRPDETAAVLDDDGWFRSGDIAVRDADGFHRIVDRAKDLIISGGENIYPAEVESALLSCPGVAECAVIGVPDAKWGEVGQALIVRSSAVEAADILGSLEGRLAKFKIPRYVRFVDDLPRTASGKLLKARLRREYGGPIEGTTA